MKQPKQALFLALLLASTCALDAAPNQKRSKWRTQLRIVLATVIPVLAGASILGLAYRKNKPQNPPPAQDGSSPISEELTAQPKDHPPLRPLPAVLTPHTNRLIATSIHQGKPVDRQPARPDAAQIKSDQAYAHELGHTELQQKFSGLLHRRIEEST